MSSSAFMRYAPVRTPASQGRAAQLAAATHLSILTADMSIFASIRDACPLAGLFEETFDDAFIRDSFGGSLRRTYGGCHQLWPGGRRQEDYGRLRTDRVRVR